MKISSFRIEGVRGLSDMEVELRDPRASGALQVVAFTGPPASGKTRLLECLIAAKEGIAPFAMPVSGESWIKGPRPSRAQLRWEFTPRECSVGGFTTPVVTTETLFLQTGLPPAQNPAVVSLLRRYEHDGVTGKLEYFPQNRTVSDSGAPRGTSAMEQRLVRLTHDPSKYSSIPRLLNAFADGPGGSANLAGQAFAAKLESLSAGCLFRPTSEGRSKSRFFHTQQSWGKTEGRSLFELSASERDAVIFAATAWMIDLTDSIVFVDRPELHVDRENLGPYLEGLLRLAPGIQLVLATDHPQVARDLGGVVVELGTQ